MVIYPNTHLIRNNNILHIDYNPTYLLSKPSIIHLHYLQYQRCLSHFFYLFMSINQNYFHWNPTCFQNRWIYCFLNNYHHLNRLFLHHFLQINLDKYHLNAMVALQDLIVLNLTLFSFINIYLLISTWLLMLLIFLSMVV